MVERFDNIGIAVTDFAAASDWYGKLGFVCSEPYGESGSFKCGDAVLYIFRTTAAGKPAGREHSLTGNPAGIDHISFRVSDVDACAQELKAKGISIEQEPRDEEWGSRTVTMLDPDGNRIWFLGPLKGG